VEAVGLGNGQQNVARIGDNMATKKKKATPLKAAPAKKK